MRLSSHQSAWQALVAGALAGAVAACTPTERPHTANETPACKVSWKTLPGTPESCRVMWCKQHEDGAEFQAAHDPYGHYVTEPPAPGQKLCRAPDGKLIGGVQVGPPQRGIGKYVERTDAIACVGQQDFRWKRKPAGARTICDLGE